MDKSKGRRQEIRFDLAFPVVVEGPFGISYCVARNISAGGIFLETDESFPLGSHLQITFELPGGGATIIALGEVKHAVRFAYGSQKGEPRRIRGIGVKFLSFDSGEVAPHLRSAPL